MAATSACATGCFRGGCLTGPNHSGTQLHGFLAYLMHVPPPARPTRSSATRASRCATTSTARDLIAVFDAFFRAQRSGEVYNIGGGRVSNCSMLEAIAMCEQITGRPLHQHIDAEPPGDHIW